MILLTGGSGLLGTELQRYLPDVYAPSHEEFDILWPKNLPGLEMIIHCAGYTDVIKAEEEKGKCFTVNFTGTRNLARNYRVPFVNISTEYVYNPVNFYSYTKILAERAVVDSGNPYLIIRTLFKPTPFPHEAAFIDQTTRGDYVDVIAPMIVAEIQLWDRRTSAVRDVITYRKTMYELAKRTKPDVKQNSIKDVSVKLPGDYL